MLHPFFLDQAFEIVEMEGLEDEEAGARPKTVLQELCIITVPSIVFTIEAGVGNKTLPMLQFETGFQGAARNWSSQVSLRYS